MNFGRLFILLFMVALTAIAFGAKAQEMEVIREKIVRAIDNSLMTDSLYTSLEKEKDRPAVKTAYMGALLALKAKHTWNPYYKLRYLNEAENTFAQAIKQDPQDIEIRFLRFSVECNVPGFLGYNKNLESDHGMIITQLEKGDYGSADKKLVVTIIRYLINSKKCSLDQLKNLNRQLIALT
jgi:hypothetical protein